MNFFHPLKRINFYLYALLTYLFKLFKGKFNLSVISLQNHISEGVINDVYFSILVNE